MSKPKRDPNVTDVEPIKTEAPAPAASPAPAAAAESDAPMPTIENEPALVFRPAAGCSILDVYEVCLMTLLVMTNSQVQFNPGALRDIQVPADRAAMLSTSARRFMQPASPPAVAPAQPEPGNS